MANIYLLKSYLRCGYNARTGEQTEAYLHFETSDGVFVDGNGFAGWSQAYTGNTGPSSSFIVVANAAGVSATAFDIWLVQGVFSGGGSFYNIKYSNTSGASWTNVATLGSSPGSSGSSTIQIPVTTNLIGPTGYTGPSVTGATGAASTVTGPTGASYRRDSRVPPRRSLGLRVTPDPPSLEPPALPPQ